MLRHKERKMIGTTLERRLIKVREWKSWLPKIVSFKWNITKESQGKWVGRIWGDDKQSIYTGLYFKKYNWTTFHSEKRLLLLEGRVNYEDVYTLRQILVLWLSYHVCSLLFWSYSLFTPLDIPYCNLVYLLNKFLTFSFMETVKALKSVSSQILTFSLDCQWPEVVLSSFFFTMNMALGIFL